jgi:hypothetical protein
MVASTVRRPEHFWLYNSLIIGLSYVHSLPLQCVDLGESRAGREHDTTMRRDVGNPLTSHWCHAMAVNLQNACILAVAVANAIVVADRDHMTT